MSQAYYRKWRPQGWDEVIGQEHVIRTLRSALAQGNLAHAYLFSGPRGTGKTTTARIIAKAVNCLAEQQDQRPCNQCENCQEINQGRFLDLIEIDAASNTSVDDVRDLREKINFSPNKGKFKVYIIDEVHMLSNAAFNALLKTLEEPPAHAIFVLATTEVHKIPPTVLSRCQRHEFRRIPLNFIQAQLKEIADKEGVQVEASALTAIARQATGSMRDAVSLLDQLASTGSEVTLELTQQVLGTAAGQQTYDLLDLILSEDTGKAIALVNQVLDSGSDPRQFARQMVDVLRAVLMVRMGNSDQLELTPDDLKRLKDISGRFDMGKLVKAIQSFDRAAQQTSLGWQPGLQLELALARLTTADEADSTAAQQPKAEKKPAEVKTKPAVKADKPAEKKKAAPPKQVEPKADVSKEKTAPQEPVKQQEKPAQPGNAGQVEDKQPAAPNAGGSDLSRIKDNWRGVHSAAKKISAETGALLNSCRSVTTHKGRLVLGFASDLLRSKMENGHNQENARKAIQQVLGIDILIDCRVAGKEEPEVPEDIDRDGVIGTALSLGGKIANQDD
jgi:DNA polymerase-3 subunit gamma/tau